MADILGFLAGREIARRAGVDDARANTLGLITGLMGTTPTALVAVSLVAQKESAKLAAAAAPPVEVPYVIDKTFDEAEKELKKAGLQVLRTDCISAKDNDVVIGQSPKSGDPDVPPGTRVVLCVSTGGGTEVKPSVKLPK